MVIERRVVDPMNHKHWERVFSKILKSPKMQYDQENPISTMKVAVAEVVGKIQKKILYRVDVEHEDEVQSLFSVYELSGEE